MNKKSLVYKIYFGTTLLFLLFSVAMRTAACLSDMNYRNGYFQDKLLINIANTAIAIAVLFAFTYVFVEVRNKNFIFNFSSPLNYVFAGTVSITLLFFARYAFEAYEHYRFLVETASARKAATEKLLSYISIALVILAILSAVHFILASLIVKLKHTRRADFGLITVIFLSLYASFLYFSNDLPINAPSKIIDQSAYLSSALFFLYEARISIGREKWRAYRAFGFIALLLTAYSAIPSLVVYIVKGAVISNSIYETILTLTIFLFIGARLALAFFLREDREAKTVTLIKTAFTERAEEINPKEEVEYDPETDEDLEGLILEDRGEYYELNFEETENEAGTETETEAETEAEIKNEIKEAESEETLINEENTGN